MVERPGGYSFIIKSSILSWARLCIYCKKQAFIILPLCALESSFREGNHQEDLDAVDHSVGVSMALFACILCLTWSYRRDESQLLLGTPNGSTLDRI